jgi:hypothetical protein
MIGIETSFLGLWFMDKFPQKNLPTIPTGKKLLSRARSAQFAWNFYYDFYQNLLIQVKSKWVFILVKRANQNFRSRSTGECESAREKGILRCEIELQEPHNWQNDI